MSTLYVLKYLSTSLIGAALLSLLSLAPASAQSYGGNYNSGAMPAGPAMGAIGNGSGYGSGSGNSYGSSSGNNYGNNVAGSDDRRFYIIRRGDTLRKIAARFGTTVSALLRANPGIRNPNLIFAGRLLLIPSLSHPRAYGPVAPGGGYGSGYTPAPGYAMPAAPYAPPAGMTQMPGMQMPSMQMPPAPAPAPAPAPGGQTVNIDLTAQNVTFSLSTITVPAGAHVVVNFTNQDAMPHDLAVYTDSSARQVIFRGQIITGPNASVTYSFTAPSQPGTYFFRCDVHPTLMMGQFVVQ